MAPTPSGPEPPDERAPEHGTPRETGHGGRRVLGTGLAGFLLLLGVGWAAWVAVSSARVPVRWGDVASLSRPDGSIDTSFELTKDRTATAVCTVEAVNGDLAPVGWTDVTVGPSTRTTVTVRAHVPTSQTATGARVKTCILR